MFQSRSLSLSKTFRNLIIERHPCNVLHFAFSLFVLPSYAIHYVLLYRKLYLISSPSTILFNYIFLNLIAFFISSHISTKKCSHNKCGYGIMYNKENRNLEVIIVNEFNEYVREVFSAAGDIVIKFMMGGYLVYLNGKLIGDICDNELFLKRTPTSDRLLADSELRYPYEGSKTLMYVFDRFEDTTLVTELLNGMYTELPEKKSRKSGGETQSHI